MKAGLVFLIEPNNYLPNRVVVMSKCGATIPAVEQNRRRQFSRSTTTSHWDGLGAECE